MHTAQMTYDTLVQSQQERVAASQDGGSSSTSPSDSFVGFGPDAVNTALLPAFLARYRTNSTDKQQGLLSAAQLNTSVSAASSLQKLTTANLGLLYYLPDKPEWLPNRADVSLNAWAAWLVAEAQQKSATPPSLARNTLAGLPYAAGVRNLTALWLDAAARQLVKNAQDARKPPVNEAYRPEVEPQRMYVCAAGGSAAGRHLHAAAACTHRTTTLLHLLTVNTSCSFCPLHCPCPQLHRLCGAVMGAPGAGCCLEAAL